MTWPWISHLHTGSDFLDVVSGCRKTQDFTDLGWYVTNVGRFEAGIEQEQLALPIPICNFYVFGKSIHVYVHSYLRLSTGIIRFRRLLSCCSTIKPNLAVHGEVPTLWPELMWWKCKPEFFGVRFVTMTSWCSKIFVPKFTSELGEMIRTMTSIYFKWVETNQPENLLYNITL